MSEKLIGGVFNDPEPTPTLAELAAPVLLMAEAFVEHQVSAGRFAEANENVAALVAFKRALKETEVPALTAEPYRHALEQRLIGSNLPGLTGDADADLMRFVFHEQEIAGYFCGQLEKDLTAERAARVAVEKGRDDALSWTQTHANMDAYRKCLATAIARAERAENTLYSAQRDLQETAAKNVDLYEQRDALRTQLAEAREEVG